MKLIPIIGLLMLVAATWVGGQTTIYVATTGNDDPGSGSAENPCRTISNAVAQAEDGDVVLVNPGVYTQTVNLHITTDITVRGMHAPTGVVITTRYPDVNYSTRCVRVSSAGAVLDGVIMEKGYPLNDYNNKFAFGGGILVEAGLVTNCIIRDNQARRGGGAALWTTNACMRNCWISNNVSAYGPSPLSGGGVVFGDIYDGQGGARLLDCVINSNTAPISGGGIYSSTDGVISNCIIAENYALNSGGGVCINGQGMLIIDAIISNNTSAQVGGGIYVLDAGYPVIRNTEVIGNKASYAGAGIKMRTYPTGGALISNCVIKGNQGSASATTLYGVGLCDGYGTGATSSGTLSVVDTKIIDNGGAGCKRGGGAWIYTHGTATFHNCEISSNSLSVAWSSGAGMYIGTGSASVVVQNCLISGNLIDDLGRGGGIFIGAENGILSGLNPLHATVESCTIADNATEYDYGGINVVANHTEVRNCVIASNQCGAGQNYPDLNPADKGMFYYSCSPELTNAEQGNTTNAPGFAGYGAGDYRPAANSPCVNAGTNQAWMFGDRDLNGRARIDRFSRVADMGCYEHVPQGIMFNLR